MVIKNIKGKLKTFYRVSKINLSYSIMPTEDVQAVIKKAISDETFKLALSRDFDLAIEKHNLKLTPDELDALKKVDWTKQIPTGADAAMAGAAWVHIYKTGMEL